MEISLRSVAKVSSVSGAPFAPGDGVESFLFRAESGEVERADLHRGEVDGWTAPGPLLCRWSHVVRERSDEEAEARRSALQSAEELFFALLEAENEAPAEEPGEVRHDRQVLLTLLSLMLERRRVLKARGRQSGLYWHPASKREIRIFPVDVGPGELVRVQAQLSQLV